MVNEQKNLVVAVVAVAAGVLTVVADLIEEDETKNVKVPGRSILGLLGLCLDHVLQHHRSLGHTLLRRYPIRLLPLADLETEGVTADQNVVAESSTTGPRHEEKSSLKMDLRKINGQFLSLSW